MPEHRLIVYSMYFAGMHQEGGQGGQLPPQILADQLTLSQPGETDYAHHITTCPPGFLTLAAPLINGEFMILFQNLAIPTGYNWKTVLI